MLIHNINSSQVHAKMIKSEQQTRHKQIIYLTPRKVKTAYISVAPIHLRVPTTLPPSWCHPARSKPADHADSISCCSLYTDGINGRPANTQHKSYKFYRRCHMSWKQHIISHIFAYTRLRSLVHILIPQVWNNCHKAYGTKNQQFKQKQLTIVNTVVLSSVIYT